MNLILLRPSDFTQSDVVRLTGRRALHLRKVLRVHAGDQVRVGLIDGLQGPAEIERLERDHAELKVRLEEPSPAPAPHRLVVALPRPPALRRILRGAASLGVKQIALIDTARVERSYWQSSQIEPAAIEEQLCLGLEQGRDTRLPEVSLHRRFGRFMERVLPEWLERAQGLVGHPEAPAPCPAARSDPSVVIVGPEGGLLDPELEALAECGVAPVTLGVRPLAIDTAVIALLGRLLP